MNRSQWKGPFLDLCIFKKNTKKTTPKIWSRRSTIPAALIGKMISIYNGKFFKTIMVTREKVGFKFGEFSTTRTYRKKIKSTKNKKKIK